MKTLRDEQCRAALIERLGRLTPNAKAAWGRMNVEQMLSHLVQTGELPFEATAPDRSGFMSSKVIKPLVLYVLPMPKEVKTGPEVDQQQNGRPPVGFDEDRTSVVDGINRIGTLPLEHKCLAHPFFGPMNAKQWATLAHKHIDHHLRQFGV
jgi:hypothetical protein